MDNLRAKEVIAKTLRCREVPQSVCLKTGCKNCSLHVSASEQYEAMRILDIAEAVTYRDPDPMADEQTRRSREIDHYLAVLRSAV